MTTSAGVVVTFNIIINIISGKPKNLAMDKVRIVLFSKATTLTAAARLDIIIIHNGHDRNVTVRCSYAH
jgi:hypothetical protein